VLSVDGGELTTTVALLGPHPTGLTKGLSPQAAKVRLKYGTDAYPVPARPAANQLMPSSTFRHRRRLDYGKRSIRLRTQIDIGWNIRRKGKKMCTVLLLELSNTAGGGVERRTCCRIDARVTRGNRSHSVGGGSAPVPKGCRFLTSERRILSIVKR